MQKLQSWKQKLGSITADIINLANAATLNTKARKIEKNIPDTTSFIIIPEFNRLTEINIPGRIKEKMKNFARKSYTGTTVDIADKNLTKKWKNVNCFI